MRVPLLFPALSLFAAFPFSELDAQAGRSGPPPQIVVQPQVIPIGNLRKTEHPPGNQICEGYAGCWGFSNGGKEYAAVACATGIWIVEVNPVSGAMTEVGFWLRPTPGPIMDRSTPWRDLVVYKTLQGRQFVFSVSDTVFSAGAQFHYGLHVVEVTNISQGMITEYVVYTASDWERAHTISVDEERGHLHISGAAVGGVPYYCIVDVSMFDPNAPPPVIRAVGDSHASFVRADQTYVSVAVHDVYVFNIPAIIQSSALPPPSGQLSVPPLSHSSWVTEDASLCVAASEGTPGALYAFALPSSNRFASFLSVAGCPAGHAPHYAYGIGRCLYVAHYTDGFHFLELGATAASGFRSIAKYDTCAVGCPTGLPQVPVLGNSALCGPYANGLTFAHLQGAWDVYPYQDSGVVYVTDTTSGLWALRIPTGHFHRTESGYADPALNPPIPDVQPDGAAPRQGATSFAFRLTDLDPTYYYDLVVGTQAMNLGQTPPVQYVAGTIVFQSPRVQPTASQHVFGWPSNYPAYSTLYAQVLAWTSATGGQLVAHSRLVDFQLLLP